MICLGILNLIDRISVDTLSDVVVAFSALFAAVTYFYNKKKDNTLAVGRSNFFL